MSDVPNSFPHLFYGYLVIWGLMVLYMGCLQLKMNGIQKKLRRSAGTDEQATE